MNQHLWPFGVFVLQRCYSNFKWLKEGLTGEEARQRLARYVSNLLKSSRRSDVLTFPLAQFKSPLILILLLATALSFFSHDPVDAFIILTTVLVSSFLGFWQEPSATKAVEKKLLAIVRIKARALRDGGRKEVENFGSMNVICSDKTGTLTEGIVHVHSSGCGRRSKRESFAPRH
jgi:P-type E1-E2 ATPase